MLSCDTAALDDLLAGPGIDARDTQDRSVLMRAAADHNLLMLAHLLSVGADHSLSDAAGHTALHLAAIAGNDGAAELLIAAGAEIDALDKNRRTPLWHAAANNLADAAIVEVLLQAGAATMVRDFRGVSPEDLL